METRAQQTNEQIQATIDKWDFSKRHGRRRMAAFAQVFKDFQLNIGFKVSSRGWCYIMEQSGVITKAEFDKVEQIINRCRRQGLLPVDFVAEEEARQFMVVHEPSPLTYKEHIQGFLDAVDSCEDYYHPDWWDGEPYYIQMVVEKIDLRTLFLPICRKYHIPIATSRGWSSIGQRAKYARRFKEAEERGLKCMLMYCGDFDPDGTRISDFLRDNLEQIKDVVWSDGQEGYDPKDLEIQRFGLNPDFIKKHKLSWIDNLVTSTGGELAIAGKDGKILPGKTSTGKPHPNFNLPYLQNYLKKYGVKKCEANSIVVIPEIARQMCDRAVKDVLGDDAHDRFLEKIRVRNEEMEAIKKEIGWSTFRKILNKRLK